MDTQRMWLKGMILIAVLVAPGPAVKIATKAGTPAELRTKAMLEQVLRDYDLSRYTFTHDVVIEERAINHAFPVLTLNARFANSEDELLSSFVHEQLHWHLRDHQSAQQRAVADLRRFYPHVPVGGTEGAETEFSTYGHLIDCYLELDVVRRLIGPERMTAVVANKGHYTWIYRTVIDDAERIEAIVKRNGLGVK